MDTSIILYLVTLIFTLWLGRVFEKKVFTSPALLNWKIFYWWRNGVSARKGLSLEEIEFLKRNGAVIPSYDMEHLCFLEHLGISPTDAQQLLLKKETKYFHVYTLSLLTMLYMPVALWILTESNYLQAVYLGFSVIFAYYLAHSIIGWRLVKAADKWHVEQEKRDK